MRLAAVLLALLAAPVFAQPLALPDLPPYILTNARIYTVDDANPMADAIAVDPTGVIAAVGSREDLTAMYTWPEVDAKGHTVIPGLIDAHAHLMNLGTSLLQADLVGTTSKADVIARLTAFEADLPEGAWLTGRGWDQNDWGEGEPFPTRADLDAAFPTRPVWLVRIDGHAGWANTAALRASGVDPNAEPPADREGGATIRDARGLPTGVYVDGAMDLVGASVPEADAAFYEEALTRALEETARFGLTGVHEAGIPLALIDMYRAFAAEGRFGIRNYAMVSQEVFPAFCEQYPDMINDERLVVRSVKVYADGALGSRGAALLAEYADEPGNTGLLFMSPEVLESVVADAMACGLQVNTHAIGDRANRAVLDAYESAMAETGAASGAGRHRIEHAQVVSLDDIQRTADLGVIASVQPTHATSDMPWAETRVGADRVRGAYAWRRLIDAGARLALGSDFPVERVSPLLGFHAAVTRQDAEDAPAGGWYGNQVLSREEALRGFTLDAAYAGFMEDMVGSLEAGKRADFVILSQDLMRVPPEAILDTEVVMTVLDGAPIYVAE
ncbi:amidohydrolase [Rubricoccus marinus]|uniref:Amidohydrolase n=1 Tax=Rubricoccus marinus TaxID=716817 RepID=A0A259U221_9BACT|nr:amidohydrolase [Rubricoccus marinus]OZC03888.1 amidohydrolase [Rubricoccus marinus]